MLNKKMFLQKKVSGGGDLPSTYQEVEYLASTGSGQYIDTLVEGNAGYHVKLKAWMSSSYASSQYGSSTPCATLYYHGGNYYRAAFLGCVERNKTKQAFNVYSIWQSYQYNVISVETDFVAEYQVKSGNSWCDIDGVRKWSHTVTFGTTPTISVYLFGTHSVNYSDTESWAGRIYYAKFYDISSGTMIKDFIPCYRKSDSKMGMYDLLGQNFHECVGTFTKGADVN